MPKIYYWRFHVRTYDVSVEGRVSPDAFLRYLEDGAVQASASAGYDYDWYREHKRLWVVRKMTMRFYAPAGYEDELELATWVSDFRRVQSNREYDLRRVGDGAQIVRARANWAFLNTETMQLERIPAEFADHFDPAGSSDVIDTALPDAIDIENPVIHTEERRVQRYELDTNAHVNNTVYLTWAEQALVNALRAAGWPPERFDSTEFVMMPYAAEIEYHRSALDNEPIWIVTRLAQVGLDRAAWHVEIRHGATGELIAKAVLVRAFSDEVGPRSIPDALQLALVQRSRS